MWFYVVILVPFGYNYYTFVKKSWYLYKINDLLIYDQNPSFNSSANSTFNGTHEIKAQAVSIVRIHKNKQLLGTC